MDRLPLRTSKAESLDLAGPLMEVIVGAEEVRFTVHESVICGASNFFKAAMGRNWGGSTTRQVRLKSVEPDTFHTYVNWLYLKTLPVRTDSPGALGNVEYVELAKAYAMGEEILDERFKNAVLDGFQEKRSTRASDGKRWFPIGPAIRHVYDKTGVTSKARILLVDLYTMHGSGNWIEQWPVEDLPWEFLRDLSIALLNRRAVPEVVKPIDPRYYHEHEHSKKCPPH
ncbi:BTB/POZ domain-containing protein [Sarocladium implicatum]|nr:BTB/POZ domain-containing protein [Sarocladium implicatum]